MSKFNSAFPEIKKMKITVKESGFRKWYYSERNLNDFHVVCKEVKCKNGGVDLFEKLSQMIIRRQEKLSLNTICEGIRENKGCSSEYNITIEISYRNSFFTYILKHKYGIAITFLTSFVILFLGYAISYKTEESKYDENKKMRPILKFIDEPRVDSMVFYFDSLALIDFFNKMNEIDSSVHSHHNAIPMVTVFYTLKYKNTGNSLAEIYADISTDSIITDFFLRNELFDSSIPTVEKNENLYNTRQVSPGDTISISFHRDLFREMVYNFGNRGKFSLHSIILFKNEKNVLFDNYTISEVGYEYPNILITSRRGPLRVLDPSPRKATLRNNYWLKKKVIEDFKIYDYGDMLSIEKKLLYYINKTEYEEAFINNKPIRKIIE